MKPSRGIERGRTTAGWRPPMSKRQAGFSLIELLIVVAIILVIAAIAIPNFLSSRMSANESSAVASVRTVSTAETAYASSYGAIGYSITYANDGNTPSVGYTVHADPVVRGQTGRRSFFSNQPGEIRYNLTAVATLTDPAI